VRNPEAAEEIAERMEAAAKRVYQDWRRAFRTLDLPERLTGDMTARAALFALSFFCQ